MSNYKKSYLKWAGSKNKMLANLLPILDEYKQDTFAEPFVGAGNVSLNFDCGRYLLNDLNNDLIVSHRDILNKPHYYIKKCKELFSAGYDFYYEYRDEFNNLPPSDNRRTYFFQYLNKHGFNGLCRYNKKGKYNVPIGAVKEKGNIVPVESILDWSNHFEDKRFQFYNESYIDFFKRLECRDNVLVYCDPPYVPMGTSDINYTGDGFTYEDQIKLKELALQSKHTVVISNHWNEVTQELYKDAKEIFIFDVQRTISCKGSKRMKVRECVAIY